KSHGVSGDARRRGRECACARPPAQTRARRTGRYLPGGGSLSHRQELSGGSAARCLGRAGETAVADAPLRYLPLKGDVESVCFACEANTFGWGSTIDRVRPHPDPLPFRGREPTPTAARP